MIDERMQQQAALHVLVALTPDEAREFKEAMAADSKLKAFVAELQTVTGALAGAVPLDTPPPQLRAKILAQVGEKQKVVSLPERKAFFPGWLPWAAAVCLVVLCFRLVAEKQDLSRQINSLKHQVTALDALAMALESTTNDLQKSVLALKESNRLAGLKIAMLNSLLADAPKAVAVSLWDDAKQEGVFVVQNLKPLPADRDYQLWVLANGTTPVDAGIFRVDENGKVRVEFKARLPVKAAAKFAVTEEVRGGVASPTLKNLVLASN